MFALYSPLSLLHIGNIEDRFSSVFWLEALKVSTLLYLLFSLCMLNLKSLYDFSLVKCFHFVPVLKPVFVMNKNEEKMWTNVDFFPNAMGACIWCRIAFILQKPTEHQQRRHSSCISVLWMHLNVCEFRLTWTGKFSLNGHLKRNYQNRQNWRWSLNTHMQTRHIETDHCWVK